MAKKLSPESNSHGQVKMGPEQAQDRIRAIVTLDLAAKAEAGGDTDYASELKEHAERFFEQSLSPRIREDETLWRVGRDPLFQNDGTLPWVIARSMDTMGGQDPEADKTRRDQIESIMKNFPDAVDGEFVGSLNGSPLVSHITRTADKLAIEQLKSELKKEIDEVGVLALDVGRFATARALGVVSPFLD